MPRARVLPSDYLLARMVEQGMTHQQIAEKVSAEEHIPVTRQAVATALSRAGLTNRVRYEETIPWTVHIEHQHSIHLWMLRVHHRLTHGGSVSEDERRRYAGWRRRLEESGSVIMYVPDSPDGFYPVPRRAGDERDLEVITVRGRND